MTRRVGVLGTFVWDTIHHPDLPPDEPLEQWGGIAYSLGAFAAACPAGWAIVPIARVGEDLAPEVGDFLASLQLPVEQNGIVFVAERNNRVELRYRDRAERTETLTGGVPPWSWSELQLQVSSLDALYVNHMSGMEMELTTAQQLRGSFRNPIYSDLHSLFLEPPSGRPRRPRCPADATRWLETADIIQLNDFELALLRQGTGIGTDEELMEHVRLAALVTRGASGATFAFRGQAAEGLDWSSHRADQKKVETGEVPLPFEPLPGDPTGCGDVWGSVVFAGLLENRPLREAVRRGHVAAAAKMRHGRMKGLTEAISTALTAYDAV